MAANMDSYNHRGLYTLNDSDILQIATVINDFVIVRQTN